MRHDKGDYFTEEEMVILLAAAMTVKTGLDCSNDAALESAVRKLCDILGADFDIMVETQEFIEDEGWDDDGWDGKLDS